jgi:hypothetical protein
MNPAGIGAEQLTIEHKRKPYNRVPVSGVAGSKSPDDTINVKAARNVLIFIYVRIIIKINKVEIADLPIDGDSAQCKGKINENDKRFLS